MTDNTVGGEKIPLPQAVTQVGPLDEVPAGNGGAKDVEMTGKPAENPDRPSRGGEDDGSSVERG